MRQIITWHCGRALTCGCNIITSAPTCRTTFSEERILPRKENIFSIALMQNQVVTILSPKAKVLQTNRRKRIVAESLALVIYGQTTKRQK